MVRNRLNAILKSGCKRVSSRSAINRSTALDKPSQLLPPPYHAPAISPAAELALMFVFGVLSPLLIDAPISGFFGPHGVDPPPILVGILFASAAARFGLLAIWLAWGASRAAWRLPLVLPGIALPVFIWTGGRDGWLGWRELVSVFLTLVLCTAAIAAAPRLLGVHRVNIYDPPPNNDGKRIGGGQFRLLDIFAWTATAAVLAAIARWVGLPRESDWIFSLLISLSVTGVFVLTAIWTVLTAKGAVHLRAIVAGGVAFVIPMVIRALTGTSDQAFFAYFASLVAMALLICGLYIARSLGVRLVVRELRKLDAPAGTSSANPPEVASRNEISPGVAASGLE
jgi:hypothetical protein